MFKKVWTTTALFFLLTSFASAAGWYALASMNYESITANQVRFLGFSPRIGLGYGDLIFHSSFYLAAEVFVNPLKSITDQNNTQNGNSLRPKYSYGASLIPGWVLDDWIMLYGRVGLVVVDFDSMNTSHGGEQIGAGIRVWLACNWDATLEYDRSSYNSLNFGTPKEDQYNLGIIYNFGNTL